MTSVAALFCICCYSGVHSTSWYTVDFVSHSYHKLQTNCPWPSKSATQAGYHQHVIPTTPWGKKWRGERREGIELNGKRNGSRSKVRRMHKEREKRGKKEEKGKGRTDVQLFFSAPDSLVINGAL